MTGAVTYEQLTWIIGIIVVAGGVVAGFLIWLWRLFKGFEDALSERDTAAQLEKERAKLVEEQLRQALADYKVQVAEKYATKEGVTQAVGRMETAIEKLSSLVHESVERITSRMDRILDGRVEAPPPRSRRSGG